MTNLSITFHDASTDEIVTREMTEEELAAREAFLLKKQNDEQTAIAAKEAAQAKLTALGLTVDDLKALGL
jgi:hypothetical protein